MELGKVKIRKCIRNDAEQISSFFNKFGYGPITSGYPLRERDIQRLFDQSEIVLFLCLEYEDTIIGTMLFSTFCGQKAADPGSVWGSKFLVHPQFRNGPLPGIFFSDSIKQLTELGYKYIDVDVDPTNSSALPLYKRVGFIRNKQTYIDYDGYLQLRTYLPLIINFLRTGYNVGDLDDSLFDSGWKSLISAKDIRSFDHDTFELYGMETFSYEMKFDQDVITCWVDMLTEEVSMMEDPRFTFSSYIVEGQVLTIGQEVTIKFKYENRLDQKVLVSFDTRICNNPLAYKNGKKKRLLEPGESIDWEEKTIITSPEEGKNTLQTSIKFGECNFTFHYGFKAFNPIDVFLSEPSSIIINQSTTLELCIQNHTKQNLSGYIGVVSHEPPAVVIENSNQLEPFSIEGQGKVLLPIKLRGFQPGISSAEVIIYNQYKEMVVTKEIEIPVLTPLSTIRYNYKDYSFLENLRITVKVDHLTGGLVIYERTTGKQVVQEAWPDLGVPFRGTVKHMTKRDLIVFETSEENTLTLLELKEDEIYLVRKIMLGSEGIVRIEDYAVGDGKLIKINPWCTLKDSVISIPFKSGTIKDTVVYEDFPFLINDFEYMHDQDLPSDPAAYSMQWSSFENNELSVGLIWEGKVDSLLYGLRWMPSVIFNRKSEENSTKSLFKKNRFIQQVFPFTKDIGLFKKNIDKSAKNFTFTAQPDAVHYYSVGYSGVHEVERVWKSLTGAKGPIQECVGRVRIQMDVPEVITKGETLGLSCNLETEHLSGLSGTVEMNIPELGVYEKRTVEKFNLHSPVELPFLIDVNSNKKKADGTVFFTNEEKGIRISKHFQFFIKDKEEIIEIERTEKKSFNVYSVNNGCIDFEVVPDLQASIISLKYKSKNLISSHFPSMKSWGQNTSTPAGIHPQKITDEINIEKGILFHAGQVETFTCSNINISTYGKENWVGLRCNGQDYTIDYLTLPNLPILKVDVEFKNHPNEQEIIHFSLNSFWNRFTKERHVYYWNSLGRHILKESKLKRRVYSDQPKAVLDLGNNYFVSMWVMGDSTKLALSEWPDKGFQLSLLKPMNKSEFMNSRISIYIGVSGSLEEAMDFIK